MKKSKHEKIKTAINILLIFKADSCLPYLCVCVCIKGIGELVFYVLLFYLNYTIKGPTSCIYTCMYFNIHNIYGHIMIYLAFFCNYRYLHENFKAIL